MNPGEMRAWLDRPCPAPERDSELANRPPEEWQLNHVDAGELVTVDEQLEAGHA